MPKFKEQRRNQGVRIIPESQVPKASMLADLPRQHQQVEMIPPEVLAKVAEMEVPETEPVQGWSLVIPANGVSQWQERKVGTTMWGRDLVLTDEVKNWCEANLRGDYWVLGEGVAASGSSATDGYQRTIEIYFTLEHDYILFRMKWG